MNKAFMTAVANSPQLTKFAIPWELIIPAIVQIFQGCKKPATDPGPMGLPAKLIDKEFKRIQNEQKPKCRREFRKAFADHSCKNETKQNEAWTALMTFAAHQPAANLPV